MKIALVKAQDTAKSFKLTAVQYPVNIAYLAAVCIEAGYEVDIWDFCVEPFTDEYISFKINEFKPDIIGISCVTPSIYFGNKIALIAKNIKPQTFVIVGGAHVSALPVETLEEFPAFDIGVLVEAENILPEICFDIEKGTLPVGIAGTVYRENGEIKLAKKPEKMPDVNIIPFPVRDLLPFDLYKNKHSVRGFSRKQWNIIEVDSSRGCIFSCTFCGVENTHGKGVRFRTPDNVLTEIESCVKKYKTDFVVFNDSTFTANKHRAIELVKCLPKIGIKGYTINSHVNTVDYELLKKLTDTGCKKISFGVESGSNNTLQKVRKCSTREKIISAFENAHRAKIPVIEGTFILGADIAEEEEDFNLTESLIKKIKPDIVALGVITPYPGTEQYEEIKNLGYFNNVSWDKFQLFSKTPPPWRIKNFNSQELINRRNTILKSYYWTPQYIFKRIKKIRSLKELIYYLEMAISFFKISIKKQ